LKDIHKHFKVPFIFKKKDYINYVKGEMNEIKKIVQVFKVKTSIDEKVKIEEPKDLLED